MRFRKTINVCHDCGATPANNVVVVKEKICSGLLDTSIAYHCRRYCFCDKHKKKYDTMIWDVFGKKEYYKKGKKVNKKLIK